MQDRDMSEKEHQKTRFEVMRKIADYCADVDCIECMFFQENRCVLNYVPADKPAVINYIKDREKEEMLFGEVEIS